MAQLRDDLLDRIIAGEQILDKTMVRELALEVKVRRKDDARYPMPQDHAYRSGPVELAHGLEQEQRRLRGRIHSLEQRTYALNLLQNHKRNLFRTRVYAGLALLLTCGCVTSLSVSLTFGFFSPWTRAVCAVLAVLMFAAAVFCLRQAD